VGLVGLIAALCLALVPGVAAADSDSNGNAKVDAMSRNLYLGADLGPALASPNLPEFFKRAGDVWNQVQQTNFPVRAKSLAKEIKAEDTDIVGLQEAALWRTGPPFGSNASVVQYDFVQNLVTELNKNAKAKDEYVVAASQDEFDFEAPANTSGTTVFTPPFGVTTDVRLTMRDAILVKNDEVKTSNVGGGHFNVVFQPTTVAGTIPVTRGWNELDAKVKGEEFHFVNTHFEAFDSNPVNPTNVGPLPKGGVRQAQAQQLLAGPLQSSKPVLLVGDLNSDSPLNGDQAPGDDLGYQVLTGGGFSERALTPPPFGCCISDPTLTNPSTAGITHRVDHIMSDSSKIKFEKGAITSTYANGLWSSDHFGVASELKVK
jgi:hypothetical protein